MGQSDIFLTTTDTLLLLILSLVYACKTCNPEGKGCTPQGWNSPAFKGVTRVSPRRGLVLHLSIWVWNSPSLTLSFMKMSSSISWLCEDLGAAMGPSPAAPESTTAVPCLLNKQEALTITHGVDNLSSSLSFITLTILPSVQVLITRGTYLENSDSSGTTKKMMSLSYPVITVTCTHNIMKPRGQVLVPPNPTKLRG